MLFFRELHILSFLYHKIATTCQIDSNKVSIPKLKPELAAV